MHVKNILSVAIAIITILTTITFARAESLEDIYYETRNRFIMQFDDITEPVEHAFALAVLEEKLKKIVGPVSIEGFPEQGKINLLTLKNDIGFGQVDGLRFESDEETLVVTTKNLLTVYLSEHPGLPETLNELSTTGDFYRLAFHPDAGITYFTEVPVQNPKGFSFVHAFLGLTSQETGLFVPAEIFVFLSTRQHILIVNARATVEITHITACKARWDKLNEKSIKALSRYYVSEMKDKKALEYYYTSRERGFAAYRDCFDGEASSQPFFPSLERQVQSIVDRVARSQETTDLPR